MKSWELANWNAKISNISSPMSSMEIDEAIKYLRENNYPKPSDCQNEDCEVYRPACKVGVCRIAVGMCGDF